MILYDIISYYIYRVVGLRKPAMPQGLLLLSRMSPVCSVVVVVAVAVVVVVAVVVNCYPCIFFLTFVVAKNRQIGGASTCFLRLSEQKTL